jgi:uncharacterized DUF497 family protein
MFDRVEGFDWDDGNARKSVAKHGVTQQEAEQVFLNGPVAVSLDTEHSQTEPRYHAVGRTDLGRLIHVTFTLRMNVTRIRVISARSASRRERTIHDEKA